MFTQPAQLRMVFPDESEGRIALETYGEVSAGEEKEPGGEREQGGERRDS